MKITKQHIKKVEKLNSAMKIINEQFQQIMKDTKNFNHSSNSIFALNRINDAADILESFYNNILEENE